jgi:hypothetical protein
MVRNPKLDGLVSQEAAAAPSHRHEQEGLKDGSSANQIGNSQERTGPKRESSTNGEAKPDTEKSPEEVAVEQDKVWEVKAETKIEAGTSSWRPLNWIVWFHKPDHSVSLALG